MRLQLFYSKLHIFADNLRITILRSSHSVQNKIGKKQEERIDKTNEKISWNVRWMMKSVSQRHFVSVHTCCSVAAYCILFSEQLTYGRMKKFATNTSTMLLLLMTVVAMATVNATTDPKFMEQENSEDSAAEQPAVSTHEVQAVPCCCRHPEIT